MRRPTRILAIQLSLLLWAWGTLTVSAVVAAPSVERVDPPSPSPPRLASAEAVWDRLAVQELPPPAAGATVQVIDGTLPAASPRRRPMLEPGERFTLGAPASRPSARGGF